MAGTALGDCPGGQRCPGPWLQLPGTVTHHVLDRVSWALWAGQPESSPCFWREMSLSHVSWGRWRVTGAWLMPQGAELRLPDLGMGSRAVSWGPIPDMLPHPQGKLETQVNVDKSR